MRKLHVGCGDVYLEGWINVDSEYEKADLIHDLRKPLPYEDNSVDYIYSEHFIEHLSIQEGLKVLSDFHRVLKKGGILRIATPNLDYVMFRYFFFWKKQAWIMKYNFDGIQTKAEMINICFREWGHQYLYNREELERRLRQTGFKKIYKVKFKKSKYPELRNKETRKESRLILEAKK
jgi:predicted SAM-dependent methyltransferase